MSIQVRQLVYRRKAFTLRIPELEFAAGRMTAIVGPNGAGKTTLLKCLSALLPVPPGSVLYNGRDVQTMDAATRARLLAFVPQEHNSAFDYTVRDFVLMGRTAYLPLFATPSTRDMNVAAEALAFVGYDRGADRPYFQLSSGERRLVLIARALAQRTDVLVLDEPTTFLDPKHETQVMELARRLSIEAGRTVLVTLHNLDLAIHYAEAVVFLKDGEVAAHGRPAEILSEDLLRSVYDIDMRILEHGGRRFIVR
jgi:iron complex transport system ATP-binding protein